MTNEEIKAFENWLLRVYQSDNSVPFAVVSKALKAIRAGSELTEKAWKYDELCK